MEGLAGVDRPKINPNEVFALLNETLKPIKVQDNVFTFSFKLEPRESIHDIFLCAPTRQTNGSLYGANDLLANYPGELDYALALYTMPAQRFDLYEKMIGKTTCTTCQAEITGPKTFYMPFSIDPLFRLMVESWSRRYKEFRVEFSFGGQPPLQPSSARLYLKKVIRYSQSVVTAPTTHAHTGDDRLATELSRIAF